MAGWSCSVGSLARRHTIAGFSGQSLMGKRNGQHPIVSRLYSQVSEEHPYLPPLTSQQHQARDQGLNIQAFGEHSRCKLKPGCGGTHL